MKEERKERQRLEQYYTPREFASNCVNLMIDTIGANHKFIEPSAGYGVFVDLLKDKGVQDIIALDLEPKAAGIIQQDFFKFNRDITGYIGTGNPPFGKSCSMAIRFVKGLFKLGATEVWFIAPKAMTLKHYALKSLSDYECSIELDMPEDLHFEIDDVDYEQDDNPVRCSFQRWVKRENPFVLDNFKVKYWSDVTPPCNKYIDEAGRNREIPVSDLDCDFVVKSHGAKVGQVMDYEDGKYKANVCRFIKVHGDVEEVRNNFVKLDYSKYTSVSTIKHNPSIAPSEMVECYMDSFV